MSKFVECVRACKFLSGLTNFANSQSCDAYLDDVMASSLCWNISALIENFYSFFSILRNFCKGS